MELFKVVEKDCLALDPLTTWLKASAARWILVLAVISGPAQAQEPLLETDYFSVSVFPATITTTTTINLVIQRTSSCFNLTLNASDLNNPDRSGRVSLYFSPATFTGCPYPERFVIPIGAIAQAGEDSIALFLERPSNPPSEDWLRPGGWVGDVDVEVIPGEFIGYAETPAQGSIQSGIGIIRGWFCEAESIAVQFNDEPLRNVAYGTTRTDTYEICGDTDNGYGAVFAWGLLGHGMHRMKTFVNGEEVSDVLFEVAGLPEPFIHGLEGEYELQDFPAPGQSVVVRWSEAEQKFVIVSGAVTPAIE